MEFEELILAISSKLDDVSGYKKSVVEADLGSLSDDIEEGIFKLRISENNYQKQKFHKLKDENIQVSETSALCFFKILFPSFRYLLKGLNFFLILFIVSYFH